MRHTLVFNGNPKDGKFGAFCGDASEDAELGNIPTTTCLKCLEALQQTSRNRDTLRDVKRRKEELGL